MIILSYLAAESFWVILPICLATNQQCEREIKRHNVQIVVLIFVQVFRRSPNAKITERYVFLKL